MVLLKAEIARFFLCVCLEYTFFSPPPPNQNFCYCLRTQLNPKHIIAPLGENDLFFETLLFYSTTSLCAVVLRVFLQRVVVVVDDFDTAQNNTNAR